MESYRMTLDFEKDKIIAQLREENALYRMFIGTTDDAKRLFQAQCHGGVSSFIPPYGGHYSGAPAYRGGYNQPRGNYNQPRGDSNSSRGGGGGGRGRGASSSSGTSSGSGPYRRRGKTDSKKFKESNDNRDNQREGTPSAKKTTAREHNEALVKRVEAQDEEIARLKAISNAED